MSEEKAGNMAVDEFRGSAKTEPRPADRDDLNPERARGEGEYVPPAYDRRPF